MPDDDPAEPLAEAAGPFWYWIVVLIVLSMCVALAIAVISATQQ